MAEQTPIITAAGSSPAELVDGAPKDNGQEAPAEQAQDKKDSAPEKLDRDSSNSDSGSGSEKDSASGDDSSNVEKKKKKKVVKEKAKKKSSGKKKEEAAAPEKPMGEDAQEEKGILEKIKEKLIGHRQPTEGQ